MSLSKHWLFRQHIVKSSFLYKLMTFHKRFYLHVNSSLWKLMTVQESMGGLVNFCLWKSSDRHHLINQTKLLKNIHVYNTGITQHDLAITNIFNSSIRLTFLTQSSALI